MMGEFFTPSVLSELQPVQDAIEASLQFLGYTDAERFRIRLSLEEALVNAVRHGNRAAPGKDVHVVFRAAPDRFDVCVADEGDSFTPAGMPCPADPVTEDVPLGRGLFLMNTFMTDVRFPGRGNVAAMAWVRLSRA